MKKKELLALCLTVYLDGGKLVEASAKESSDGKFKLAFKGQKDPQLERKVYEWIDCYLQGALPKIHLPFADTQLSRFTLKVLSCISRIPYGKTITYKELAKAVGSPLGFRAAGSACGKNPFLLFIPCHRVVGVSTLGGFAAGLEVKRRLLSFEEKILTQY